MVDVEFFASFLYSGKRSASMILSTAAAKSLQSCPTLCDPIDGSPPGSAVPGILQERVLEWVAIAFSGSSQLVVAVCRVKSTFCCVSEFNREMVRCCAE